MIVMVGCRPKIVFRHERRVEKGIARPIRYGCGSGETGAEHRFAARNKGERGFALPFRIYTASSGNPAYGAARHEQRRACSAATANDQRIVYPSGPDARCGVLAGDFTERVR